MKNDFTWEEYRNGEITIVPEINGIIIAKYYRNDELVEKMKYIDYSMNEILPIFKNHIDYIL